jgi:adenylate cyclase
MLFTDIRGFTALTEKLGPSETAATLERYFSILSECLHRRGGKVETVFGDSLLGTFGTTDVQKDDADRAVQAAIFMRIELAQWNSQRHAVGKPTIDMGIGINTDNVLYRPLGLPTTDTPIPVGSGINLAARLEAACKQYSAKILISGTTFRLLQDTYTCRYVDAAILPGTQRATEIFEILDFHTDETFPNLEDVLPRFHDGVAYYRRQRFKDAMKAFRSALSFNPRDQLSRQYIERCKTLLKSPPNADWCAIWMPA